MKYMLLIHHGDTPTPPSEAWDRLPDADKQAVYAAYGALTRTPGATPAYGWTNPRWRPPSGSRTA